jgi:uncharacterized lipoprotein NlpE involved in copper resistance
MKKVCILILAAIFLLMGCTNGKNETKGTLKNVTVKEKHTEGGYRFTSYHILFDKKGQEIELLAEDETEYNALKKGLVVTVSYDDDYHIQDIKFPELEK